MAMSSISLATPPVFSGENYQIWATKMKTYLKAFDLWNVVETGEDPPPLRANPTLAQIKNHNEESMKKFKALTCIQTAVSDSIFTRIMACETAKEAWDKLKEEFQGSERTIQMRVLNLRREFENLKMKDSDTVQEFTDRLLKVVNQIRMLEMQLADILTKALPKARFDYLKNLIGICCKSVKEVLTVNTFKSNLKI
ncbi:hypothetical protein GH714_022530 [Hevea brasiliensis]|uniref:Uncharacterized protein n=1 Tax=Hevea brasiliensis TaxID=3981 RepID=A0A6A6N684_HEVBR|nr:hypothetical protein GH714_022530 [Hevea brasiliensis]